MALFVKIPVEFALVAAIFPRRDNWGSLLAEDEADDRGGVIGLVRDDISGFQSVDQGDGRDAVVNLTAREFETDWVAQRINNGMNFCRQAASAAANGLGVAPPFAPAECWWART